MIEYRLDLHNRQGDNVFTLPAVQLHSFTYSKFLRTGGSIEVRMHDVVAFNKQFALPEHLDYMWKVYRRNTLFQDELTIDAIGLHRATQQLQLNDGNYLNYSYAVSMNDLLMTEATSLTNYEKSGVISSVALEYAKDLLVQFPSITFPNVSYPSSIQWAGDRRYKKLVTILNELAEIDNANYAINNNLEFVWLYPIDNDVVVYSDSGQITNFQIVKNYVQLATHVTVLGNGVDELRLNNTEYLDDFYQKYGEYYFNHVVRTGAGKTIPALQEIGIGLLNDRLDSVVDIKFNLANHPSFQYIRDFDVGHIITIDFFGSKHKVMIHYVYVTRTKEGIDTILVGCNYVNS